MEKPIKEGILHLQQYKFGMKVWKKSWFMLYPGSSQSIARLEQSDAKEGSTALDKSNSKKVERIIRLSNCISISQIQVENTPKDMSAFCISTMDKNWILAAPKQDIMPWINCLCELAFENATVRKKSEDFSASSSKLSSDSFSMKENELYSSVAQAMPDNHFAVTVQKTTAATRCNLQGKYTLIIGKDSLILKEPVTKKVVYKWPYQFLRRYGTDQEAFMFEAGRRCDSGEGVFLFSTKEDGKIYHIVDKVVKALESNKEHQPSNTSTGPGRKQSNAASFPQELDNQKSQGGSECALKIEQNTKKGSKTTKSKSNQDWKGYNSACEVGTSAETVGKSKVMSTEEREGEQVVYATIKLPKDKSTKGNMKNLTPDPTEYREGGEDDDSETSPVYENISEREFSFFFKEESFSFKDIERPTYQRSGENTEDKDEFSDSEYVNLATEWSQQVTEDDYETAQVNQKIDVYTYVDRKRNKERGASPNPETSKITKAKLPPGFHEMLSDLFAVELSKTRDGKEGRSSKTQQDQGKKRTGEDCEEKGKRQEKIVR